MSRPTDPLDTYLLRVLVMLVNERSVSRTAIRLNQSQPTVSIALKRLREIFGDPLLVRQTSGMVPTDRALMLRDHARRALNEIDTMRAGLGEFDPASSMLTFRIGSPDFMVASFLAAAVERFCREAPGARLVVQPLGSNFDYEGALAEGELDVAIGNWPEPPEGMHLSVLLEDEVVCLLSRNDPRAARGLSREQYLVARHVVPLPYSKSQRGGVETFLASQRLQRDARVVVPFFELAPYLLVNTDLVFTTARHFAEHFARTLPLAIVPAPVRVSAHALLPALARALSPRSGAALAAQPAVGGGAADRGAIGGEGRGFSGVGGQGSAARAGKLPHAPSVSAYRPTRCFGPSCIRRPSCVGGPQPGDPMKPANTSSAHKSRSDPRQGKTTAKRMEETEPRLPHEHDQSSDSQDSQPREKMRQAHDDLERGLTDTDKGPELDKVYRRNFRPAKG